MWLSKMFRKECESARESKQVKNKNARKAAAKPELENMNVTKLTADSVGIGKRAMYCPSDSDED